VHERDRGIETLNSALSQTRREFEVIQRTVRDTVRDLEITRSALERMQRSLSWRLSAPVRILERLGRSFGGRTRNEPPLS
jgi:hypothetical protein